MRPSRRLEEVAQTMIRRFLLFAKTYRQARRLGFTLVDATRAALVNSRSA
jgi:hypothetical protein